MGVASGFPWRRGLLIFGLALSLAMAAFFAVRTYHSAPRSRINEPLRAWMNIPYIAHAYQVPEAVLFQAIGLPDNPKDKRPVLTIARLQHRTNISVIADLNKAISEYRSLHPATPTPTPHSSSATL